MLGLSESPDKGGRERVKRKMRLESHRIVRKILTNLGASGPSIRILRGMTAASGIRKQQRKRGGDTRVIVERRSKAKGTEDSTTNRETTLGICFAIKD